jgi:hypothetical protein
MEVIYPRCGLDVHMQTVVACVRIAGDGPPLQEVRTFDTTPSGLLALANWLDSFGVEHVGTEATGVYWMPVWHLLEGHFDLVLANAAHVKNVLGRKTDVNDARSQSGGLTTTYCAPCGWYHVLPHCWYTMPPTLTGTQPGGGAFTIDPMTAEVTATAVPTATAVATG